MLLIVAAAAIASNARSKIAVIAMTLDIGAAAIVVPAKCATTLRTAASTVSSARATLR